MDRAMKGDDWQELSRTAQESMVWLGHFYPTVNIEQRQVKGYMIDPDGDTVKTYLSADELRQTAADFIEVAAWLDARADAARRGNG